MSPRPYKTPRDTDRRIRIATLALRLNATSMRLRMKIRMSVIIIREKLIRMTTTAAIIECARTTPTHASIRDTSGAITTMMTIPRTLSFVDHHEWATPTSTRRRTQTHPASTGRKPKTLTVSSFKPRRKRKRS